VNTHIYNVMQSPKTLALALLILTAACASDHDRVDPPVRVPDRFSASGHDRLPKRWWESFNDPVLNRFIETALADNLDLKTAWDRLAQAEEIARREGADLEPALDLTAGASRTRARQEVAGGSRNTTYANEFSLGVAAGYELDVWGRVRSRQEAAALDMQAGAADIQAAAITLSSRVAATWYQLVEQRGQLEILSRQLETNTQVLDLITLRFRRGQVKAADVLRQRQLIESNRGDLQRVESRAKVLGHRLAILLGKAPEGMETEKTTSLIPLPPLPDPGLPADLIQRRPDIRRAHLDLLAADRRAAAAVAESFPRINLFARISTTSEKVSDLFDNWLAGIAADLVAPIIDGGSRRAEADRARAVLSERINAFGQVVLESLGEVEDALIQEEKQQVYIVSLQKQLDLSDQVVLRIRDSYTSGAVDYLRILDALLSNQSLQRTLLMARRERIEFRINLCRALAGGFDLTRPEPAVMDRETGNQIDGGSVDESQ